MQFIFNDHRLQYEIPLFSLGLIIVFHTLVVLKPKWPFHSVFFFLMLIFGLIFNKWLNSFTKNTILEADWPNNLILQSSLNSIIKKNFISSLLNSLVVFEPYFMINMVSLAVLTIIECTITIKLTGDMTGQRINKEKELISVAITNILGGILGWVPVSIPVCTNILVVKLGTNSKVYMVLAAVFLVLVVWLLPMVFANVPMILVSVFNVSLGLMMFNPDLIYYYWKFNKKALLGIIGIMVISFFVHIVFSILIAWVVFFGIYLNRVPNKSFILMDLKDFAESFCNVEIVEDMLQLIHVDSPVKSEISTSLNDLVNQVVTTGFVYQLQGRFNFIFFECHLQNFEQLFRMTKRKGPVVVDFSNVWDYDREFMREYQKLIDELMIITNRLYVSGIPIEVVGENNLEKGTWIEQLDEENRLLFTNLKMKTEK